MTKFHVGAFLEKEKQSFFNDKSEDNRHKVIDRFLDRIADCKPADRKRVGSDWCRLVCACSWYLKEMGRPYEAFLLLQPHLNEGSVLFLTFNAQETAIKSLRAANMPEAAEAHALSLFKSRAMFMGHEGIKEGYLETLLDLGKSGEVIACLKEDVAPSGPLAGKKKFQLLYRKALEAEKKDAEIISHFRPLLQEGGLLLRDFETQKVLVLSMDTVERYAEMAQHILPLIQGRGVFHACQWLHSCYRKALDKMQAKRVQPAPIQPPSASSYVAKLLGNRKTL